MVARKHDRYELEIIISLGFLILFLISLNFISGYSFVRAIRGQSAQFENSANVAANLIRTELQNDMERWGRSRELLLERLRDLSILTGIEGILDHERDAVLLEGVDGVRMEDLGAEVRELGSFRFSSVS